MTHADDPDIVTAGAASPASLALVTRRRVVTGLGAAFVLPGVQTAWLPVLPPTAGRGASCHHAHARRRHPDRVTS